MKEIAKIQHYAAHDNPILWKQFPKINIEISPVTESYI
ncbi:hypothetical protein GJA_3546 [Janthinobacterium agaricidamnosum NBRC 102515 = DSM 9628]|uniref:Uncharacterized protein n=1 Tax=Janthinobacterium agaricidamnosum NBRC 102515 = DSM 9628 TaxID=1349767 RepID=W0V8E5_9BURK|nr:hypothetical protein GJA_3546 [Janthinobacterium agaricidamnosum NBRC 102515 = DSM 9628]